MKTIKLLVNFKGKEDWVTVELSMGKYKKESNRIIAFITDSEEKVNCVRSASNPEGYCFVGHNGKWKKA